MQRNEVIQKFIEEEEQVKSGLSIMPYNWCSLKNPLPICWMAYDTFLEEHARELANSINEFRRYIVSLSVWEKVIDGLDQEEKHQILIWFISPIATIAINMPYIIRSRFIYSISHLSHQANRLKSNSWVDDLPIDEEIYFKEADKYGKPWNKYAATKLSIEKIANKSYAEGTKNFRNKYNHRYSPKIEIGITGLVERMVKEDGKVSYGFGQTDPLMLIDIIPLLRKQHEICFEAFKRYQDLVREQIVEINNSIVE